VLTILWDAQRCDDAPADEACVDQGDLSVAEVEDALYGPAGADGGDNVRDFFLRMSGGRFTIANAGVLGWHDADMTSDHYWSHPWNTCGASQDGYTSGHSEKLAEAVGKADAAFDFAQFDRNADGTVDTHELAIVVVIPQPNGTGSSIQPLYASQCPESRMMLDGVVLPQKVAEWYTSLDDSYETYQFTTGAHELMHLIGGLDDMYVGEDHATFQRNLSLMSSARWTTSQLDPLSKLALGWVTPRTITADGIYTVEDVSTSELVYVLPRYNSTRSDEFYLIENRRDLNVALHDDNGIGDSGIAVWQIVTDAFEMSLRPTGVPADAWNTNAAAVSAGDPAMYGKGTQARWGIRLLRSFEQLAMDGTAMFDNKDNTLWDASEYDLHSGACPAVYLGPGFFAPNVLAWADCTASGYHIDFLTAPGAQMQVEVGID
jgi:M6 family metalloprotease-like protein